MIRHGVLICWILMLFAVQCVCAQGKIYGVVADENGQELPAAAVVLKDAAGVVQTYAYTDDMGYFELSGLKVGRYLLVATAVHYEQQIIWISIDDTANVEQLFF